MKPSIHSKLDSIFGYPFFKSVGERLPPTVKSVNSWSIAMKHATARNWENCRLQARNTLDQMLAYRGRDAGDKNEQLRHWERRNEWGPLVDELRPVIRSFLDTALAKTSVPDTFVEKIKVELSWDIMFICLEQEFRDLVKPPFHLPLLDPWYASGHFPCGWNGKQFPERWPEKELPYLDAKRIGELWDDAVREGRIMVF